MERRCFQRHPRPSFLPYLILLSIGCALFPISIFGADPVPTEAKDTKSPIQIAEIKRTQAVDFQSEILPILKRNCLACHNRTTHEENLVLESPVEILKGGNSGAAVTPGNSSNSLMLQLASHQKRPHMPPPKNKVAAVELLPDELGLIKLWIDQGAKGQLRSTIVEDWKSLPANLNPILALDVTPDSQFAACSRGNEVYIYRIPTKEFVARLQDYANPSRPPHRDLVESLAFSPDGNRIASGSFREVKIWKRNSRPQIVPSKLTTTRRRPPALLLTKNVEVLQITNDLMRYITNQAGPIIHFADRPDRLRSASVGTNQVGRIWQTDPPKMIAEFRSGQRERLEFTRHEEAITVARGDTNFFAARLTSTKTNQTAQLEQFKKLNDAKTAADKTLIDKQAALAVKESEKVAAENELAELDKSKDKERKQVTDKIEKTKTAITVAKKEVTDAEKVATKANRQFEFADEEVKKAEAQLNTAQNEFDEAQRNLLTAELRLKIAQLAKEHAESALTAIAFSPDNRFVATVSGESSVDLWNADDATPLGSFESGNIRFDQVTISADNQIHAVSKEGTACTWQIAAVWTLERTIGDASDQTTFANRVTALAFSNDGQRLITGGGEPSRGGEIKIWNLTTGKLSLEITNPHSDVVLDLAVSPDGKLLATSAADKFIRIFNLETGAPLRSFEGHTHHVLGVAWSRDQRTLVSAGADNIIKVWDSLKGDRKKNIETFGKEITAIHYVGTTDQFVAVAGDGQAKLISESGNIVRSFAGASDYLYVSRVSADGKLVLAGGQDSVLRVWKVSDGKSIANFEPPKGQSH